MTATLITAGLVVVSFATLIACGVVLERRRRRLRNDQERIFVQIYGQRKQTSPSSGPPRRVGEPAEDAPAWLPLLGRLGRRLQRLTPKENNDDVSRLLALTQKSPWPAAAVVALQFICAAVGALLLLWVGLFADRGIALTVAGGVIGAGLGFAYPRARLRSAFRRKQEEVERALPDFLDLLVLALEAGLTLPAAITYAVEDNDNVLDQEVQVALRQYQLGVPMLTAMKQVADGLELRQLQSVVRLMIQSQKLGTELGKVLRIHADRLRHRRRTRARELGLQAPVKMLMPMMGCIFPTILVVILGPAGVGLLTGHH